MLTRRSRRNSRRRSEQQKRDSRLPGRRSLLFEPLEDRTLLSFSPHTFMPSPDVNITQRSGGDAEATIAINPTNPLNMIMGVNAAGAFDTVWNTFDGGANWTAQPIPNFPGSGAGGDPTVVFNSAGLAVYAHLSSGGISSAVSADGGNNWTAGQITPDASGDDKEFLAVGPDVDNLSQDRFYIGWQRGGTLLASSSTDGINWSAPVPVNDNAGTNGVDAQLAVGPQGELYYAWETFDSPSRILVDKSVDGGANWGDDKLVANRDITLIGPPPFGIDCTPLVLQDDYCIPAAPNRGVSLSLSIDVDRSFGPNHGNLYLAFMDQKIRDGATASATERYDTDIYVVRSTNGGSSFSGLLRVNDDIGNASQFYPWLSVDQWSGNVGISWYDARNDTGAGGPGDTNNIANDDAQYFSAVSLDGGLSFSPNVQMSDGTSNGAAAGNFNYGDYTGSAYFNDVFHMVWADNSNSTGDNPDGALSNHDIYYASAQLIGPDEFEANNTLATATILGSLQKITLRDLTIDKDDDVDFFKYTAQDTGKLIVNTFFDSSFGNLELRVRDSNNNIIQTGLMTNILPGLDAEQLVIPVVSQEEYFIEVLSVFGDLNVYDLEIENFATPVPIAIDLAAADDTGMSSSDDVTSQNQGTITILADLFDFDAMGIDILTPAEVSANEPGAAVEVFVRGQSVGFADPDPGSNSTLFTFQFAGGDLSEGLNVITAAVRIFDAQQAAGGVADPATGRSQLSAPLWVTLDTIAPAPSIPDLLTSSDTGMFNNDDVTSKMSPAFSGQGEPNAKVRVLVATVAQDTVIYSQGFETDTSGWFDSSNGWEGSVARVISGTGGIASASGAWHAEMEQGNSPDPFGPFTDFGGFNSVWPGGITASTDIYLDKSWLLGEGFDYAVAINNQLGDHLRDFIFHVTQDTSTGDLLVAGSNNTNFDPREDLETIDHFVIPTSDWYTFEHVFFDDGGVLAVDLNLYNSSGVLLFTETRSDPADLIATVVGGNRYGWNTNIDISGGIAVDNVSLTIV